MISIDIILNIKEIIVCIVSEILNFNPSLGEQRVRFGRNDFS